MVGEGGRSETATEESIFFIQLLYKTENVRIIINWYKLILSIRSLQAIDTKKFGDKVKAGFEKAITEAETGLGLKTNKPYKGRAPVFAIDDESGMNQNYQKQW